MHFSALVTLGTTTSWIQLLFLIILLLTRLSRVMNGQHSKISVSIVLIALYVLSVVHMVYRDLLTFDLYFIRTALASSHSEHGSCINSVKWTRLMSDSWHVHNYITIAERLSARYILIIMSVCPSVHFLLSCTCARGSAKLCACYIHRSTLYAKLDCTALDHYRVNSKYPWWLGRWLASSSTGRLAHPSRIDSRWSSSWKLARWL